jgi:dTDP-4-amino-4,6-dideoxygalactose transaminase
MQIPFLDLKAQYKQIEHEVVPVVTEAMAGGAFIGGPQVAGFETEFAEFCDSRYCIGVGSGTDALRFALGASGIGPGDEVITVPNTFIATTEAISQVGAVPVFVDVDPHTYTMDPRKLEDYLKSRNPQPITGNSQPATRIPQLASRNSHPATRNPPKAVIPVHLYGQPADMDPILELASQHNLIVIEDACQAHGAMYKDKKAGSLGTAGCFSFYPGKNLGAFGEAGAVVTQDEAIAGRIRMLRDHGQGKKYFHSIEGFNGRLDAIQAGVLRIKLKRLKRWNQARREHAAYYTELLDGIQNVILPEEADFVEAVYHLYVILVDNREGLQEFLQTRGINTGLHYPLPLHLQKAYAHLGYKKGDFPVAENAAKHLLSLPIYPEITRPQIEYVVDSISRKAHGVHRDTKYSVAYSEKKKTELTTDTHGRTQTKR